MAALTVAVAIALAGPVLWIALGKNPFDPRPFSVLVITVSVVTEVAVLFVLTRWIRRLLSSEITEQIKAIPPPPPPAPDTQRAEQLEAQFRQMGKHVAGVTARNEELASRVTQLEELLKRPPAAGAPAPGPAPSPAPAPAPPADPGVAVPNLQSQLLMKSFLSALRGSGSFPEPSMQQPLILAITNPDRARGAPPLYKYDPNGDLIGIKHIKSQPNEVDRYYVFPSPDQQSWTPGKLKDSAWDFWFSFENHSPVNTLARPAVARYANGKLEVDQKGLLKLNF
jgi:hypothetical protein